MLRTSSNCFSNENLNSSTCLLQNKILLLTSSLFVTKLVIIGFRILRCGTVAHEHEYLLDDVIVDYGTGT